ncbi:MAG: hypothetical protein ACJATI_002523 [Halioglobus sp.]|jgi:hypothetical protein
MAQAWLKIKNLAKHKCKVNSNELEFTMAVTVWNENGRLFEHPVFSICFYFVKTSCESQ